MLHIGRVGINQLTGNTGALATLLQLHAEVCSVSRILLRLAERGRRGIEEVDGRIVGCYQRVGRILGDPRQNRVALCEKLFELR